MAKLTKETVKIHGDLNLVEQIDREMQKTLFRFKVKAKVGSYSVKITSTQPLIRKAEVEAVGEKQVHAGARIMEGIVKQFLQPVTGAKNDKDKKKAIEALEKQIGKINTETAKVYQDVMEKHWKAIKRAEEDAEEAVRKAEEAERKAQESEKKLSKTDWFRLVLRGLALKKVIEKLIQEVLKALEAAQLSILAFAQEKLRVDSEVERGTPPEVIKKQRQILVSGHVAQTAQRIKKLAQLGVDLVDKLEPILELGAKVDPTAAKMYDNVRNLQFELKEAGKGAEAIQKLLEPFLKQSDQLITKLVDLTKGEVPAKQTLSTDLQSQLPQLEEAKLKSFLDLLGSATKTATKITK